MKKICLFGGYVSKNTKDVFKRVRKKNHNFACASNKRLLFNSVERREHYLVILKNVGCFVRVFSKQRVNTKCWVSISGFVWFSTCLQKKSSKNKESESGEIKAIFVHCIYCLTCVEKMRAIYFTPKFEWSVLIRTRS